MNSKESFKDLKLPENAIKVDESSNKPNKEEKTLIKSKRKKYIIIGGIILGIIIIFVAIFLIVDILNIIFSGQIFIKLPKLIEK